MNQEKMERMEYFISLLDDYIDGTLSRGKTDEIEKMIKEDVFYEEVLKQHVHLRGNVRVTGEAELRKKFADQFDPIQEETTPKSNPLKILLPIILLIGIAIGAYLFLTRNDNPQEQKPYIESVEDKEGNLLLASVEDPSYNLLRSEQDSKVADSWQQAVFRLTIKDYTATLDILSALESDSSFVTAHIGKFSLMKGVSNLKLQRYDLADKALSQIPSENQYFDQAEWYRALTSYYAKDNSEAKSRLDQIANNTNHYKSNQAKIYLKSISE